MRIGAINWDAGLPEDTYFGSFTLRTLGNEKYCDRLPFYAKKQAGVYTIPPRTQDDYDRELMYAIEGGIDFFAYCWYPDTAPEERTIWRDTKPFGYMSAHYPELNRGRKLYQTSALRNRINMCAIIFSMRSYAPKDMDELFDAMRQDYYEKIDGRPLVITFCEYEGAFIEEIRALARAAGLDPFFAFISSSGDGDYSQDHSAADGVTAYASAHGAGGFRELTDITKHDNEKRLKFGLPVIPILSMGWNPMPRIDKPSPWVSYPEEPYAGLPDEGDMEYGFEQLMAFVKECPQERQTGYAMVFAWNEFEEGGYLCPTLQADGGVDDHIIRAFARIREKSGI